MNRRKFLQRLGVGAAVAVVAPVVAKELLEEVPVTPELVGQDFKHIVVGKPRRTGAIWTESGRLHAIATGTYQGNCLIHFDCDTSFKAGDTISIKGRSSLVISSGDRFIQFLSFNAKYVPEIKVGEQITVVRIGSEFSRR